MRWLGSLVLATVAASAMAQSAPTPVQLRVRHADPWFIKAMLEGRQVFTPEISTALAFLGGGMSFAGPTGNALLKNGRLIVNPTDNSIWFIPDR